MRLQETEISDDSVRSCGALVAYSTEGWGRGTVATLSVRRQVRMLLSSSSYSGMARVEDIVEPIYNIFSLTAWTSSSTDVIVGKS
jgi:hypothetical protein